MSAVGSGIPRQELLERIRKAVDAEPLDRPIAVAIAESLEADPAELLEPLLEAARELADRGHGRDITVSRNVFIPLTNLCWSRCGYCSFAVQPDSPQARTYTLDEVRETAERARRAGCLEALFCLGDRPERAHAGHRRWLEAHGHSTTAGYLVDACRVAFEAGMFPHTNAGVLSLDEMRALRPYNASMGLMLETTSRRLRERGQVHYHSPTKEPEARLRMTREAGALRIPFTSGLLVGIGETPAERVDTLLAIRDLQDEGGHIQEVIVQTFHPKPGTPLAASRRPGDVLMAGTTALTRMLLGPEMNVQAPPNLSTSSLEILIRAGVNDWGGVSPVSIDFINPEAPWPELDELRRRTAAAGYRLRERHAVYPRLIEDRPELFDPEMLRRLRSRSDAEGHPVVEERP